MTIGQRFFLKTLPFALHSCISLCSDLFKQFEQQINSENVNCADHPLPPPP